MSPLKPGFVDVWFAELSFLENQMQDCEKWLSQDELARAGRFLKESDRVRYRLSCAVLRIILARYLKFSPEKIVFQTEKAGKPFVADTDLQFNLSHSGDYLLVGVAWQNPIGVDIECERTNKDYLALAKRFFSPIEYEAVAKLPQDQQVAAFYRCWARKEAFIKGIGLGLSFPLFKFTVSILPEADEMSCLKHVDDKRFSQNDWLLRSLSPPGLKSDCHAALAVYGKRVQIHYHKFTHDLC